MTPPNNRTLTVEVQGRQLVRIRKSCGWKQAGPRLPGQTRTGPQDFRIVTAAQRRPMGVGTRLDVRVAVGRWCRQQRDHRRDSGNGSTAAAGPTFRCPMLMAALPRWTPNGSVSAWRRRRRYARECVRLSSSALGSCRSASTILVQAEAVLPNSKSLPQAGVAWRREPVGSGQRLALGYAAVAKGQRAGLGPVGNYSEVLWSGSRLPWLPSFTGLTTR